ncbi:MAG: CPBP family intramembrane glutamic endopeptidase [Dehalococcoidales bacterium]|jgi:membrane protease YdiL (CAAX protease family)
MRLLREELANIYDILKRNSNETAIIVAATLFFVLNRYHPIQNDWLSSFVYFAVLPILVIVLVLRKNPLDFGLRLGNVRIWGFYVLVIIFVSAAILYACSYNHALQNQYRMANFNLLCYFLKGVISLSAQEFIYRGFLLFGLKDKFKEGSILLQMVPFVLLHLGKTELETLSTIITGVLFGYVAYRSKSYWPAFIIHLFINIFFVSLINYKYT